jgi:hypothetical protein
MGTIRKDAMRVYLVYRMEDANTYSYHEFISELHCITLTEDKAIEIVNELNKGIRSLEREAYYNPEDVIE